MNTLIKLGLLIGLVTVTMAALANTNDYQKGYYDAMVKCNQLQTNQSKVIVLEPKDQRNIPGYFKINIPIYTNDDED